MRILCALLLLAVVAPTVADARPRPMRHELRMARIESGVALQRAKSRTYFWQTAANVTGIFRPSLFTIHVR